MRKITDIVEEMGQTVTSGYKKMQDRFPFWRCCGRQNGSELLKMCVSKSVVF